jgi:hypothetical protein
MMRVRMTADAERNECQATEATSVVNDDENEAVYVARDADGYIDIKYGPDDQLQAGGLHDRQVGHSTDRRVQYDIR